MGGGVRIPEVCFRVYSSICLERESIAAGDVSSKKEKRRGREGIAGNAPEWPR